MMNIRCEACGESVSVPPGALSTIACTRCGATIDLHAAHTVPMEPSPMPSTLGEDETLSPGTVIGQYRILELVGRGGMGAVYRAEHTELGRIVAIKVLTPKFSRDAEFVERFRREAKVLARLAHPNIVQVFDFGMQGQIHFIVMEFVEGVNARQLLSKRMLSPAQALHIVPKLCQALEYAHAKGIIHRDLKPENILIDKSGEPKIADFGLAKLVRGDAVQGSLTATSLIMGTPDYMAPEQRESSKGVDHRADIYSMGVVLYEMLTGQLPLGRFDPPSKKVTVDLRIDEVVLKALDSEPERRYQRASVMGTDITQITTTPAPAPSRAGWWSTVSQGQRLLLFVGGCCALMAFAGFSDWSSRKDQGALVAATSGAMIMTICALLFVNQHIPTRRVITDTWSRLTAKQKQKIGSFVIVNAGLWVFFLAVAHTATPAIIVTVFWGIGLASELWKAHINPPPVEPPPAPVSTPPKPAPYLHVEIVKKSWESFGSDWNEKWREWGEQWSRWGEEFGRRFGSGEWMGWGSAEWKAWAERMKARQQERPTKLGEPLATLALTSSLCAILPAVAEIILQQVAREATEPDVLAELWTGGFVCAGVAGFFAILTSILVLTNRFNTARFRKVAHGRFRKVAHGRVLGRVAFLMAFAAGVMVVGASGPLDVQRDRVTRMLEDRVEQIKRGWDELVKAVATHNVTALRERFVDQDDERSRLPLETLLEYVDRELGECPVEVCNVRSSYATVSFHPAGKYVHVFTMSRTQEGWKLGDAPSAFLEAVISQVPGMVTDRLEMCRQKYEAYVANPRPPGVPTNGFCSIGPTRFARDGDVKRPIWVCCDPKNHVAGIHVLMRDMKVKWVRKGDPDYARALEETEVKK